MKAKCEECAFEFETPKKEKNKYGTLLVCPNCESPDWEYFEAEKNTGEQDEKTIQEVLGK